MDLFRFRGTNRDCNRGGLDEVLRAITKLRRDMTIMFEETRAQVEGIVNAADAMEVVLESVKVKLDALLASSNLTPADRAELEAIHKALGDEAADIIAKTLANTPAAADVPTP